MTVSKPFIAMLSVAALLTSTAAMAQNQGQGQNQGPNPGQWHHGAMDGSNSHHGKGYSHGSGYGYGRDGCNKDAKPLETPLTTDDVTQMMERKLERRGNARIQLGSVTQTDDTTITAEIVTKDGSLVEKFAIDRTTGQWTIVND